MNTSQRAVVAAEGAAVQVADVPFTGLAIPDLPGVHRRGHQLDHGAVVQVLATCLCGSDLHVINNPDVAVGSIQGHEATGVVVEVGPEVRRIRTGDICSIPFNVACGQCGNCGTGLTAHCRTTGTDRPGATYGMGKKLGGWPGLQSEWALVPHADFNLYAFDDRDAAQDQLLNLSLLTDTLPTGYHAATQTRVGPGTTVYIGGAGPIGLATAAACQLRGAEFVAIGDPNHCRRAHARSVGFETANPYLGNIPEQIAELIGTSEVDVAIDCVGGTASALDDVVSVARPGGHISLSGVYPATLPNDQHPLTPIWLGGIWSKALRVTAGSTPVRQYQDVLARAVLQDGLKPAQLLGAKPVSLENAVAAYDVFQAGSDGKFVFIPSDSNIQTQDLPRQHSDHTAALAGGHDPRGRS